MEVEKHVSAHLQAEHVQHTVLAVSGLHVVKYHACLHCTGGSVAAQQTMKTMTTILQSVPVLQRHSRYMLTLARSAARPSRVRPVLHFLHGSAWYTLTGFWWFHTRDPTRQRKYQVKAMSRLR